MARPKKRRKGQLRGLAELLRRVHPAPEQIDEARVFGFWLTALPEKIVSRARPTRLQHGILHVNVISSVWAHELHHMHDPNQDRLMLGYITYFRPKFLRLPKAYRDFIVETLAPGGTLIITDCRLRWPTSARPASSPSGSTR